MLQGSLAETVSISNLGVAKTGPVVEESGSLLLEYVNGSACTTSDGRLTTYSTRIHLVCGRGRLVSAVPKLWQELWKSAQGQRVNFYTCKKKFTAKYLFEKIGHFRHFWVTKSIMPIIGAAHLSPDV